MPTVGPGTSARIRCIPWPSVIGSTAMTNTSTPMPPTQWVKLRQNRQLRRRGSTAVRMVEPVVVKPETVSKKASIKLGMSPESTKGSAPKRDMKTHARATTASPSRAYRDICRGFLPPSRSPTAASSNMGIKKGSGDSR